MSKRLEMDWRLTVAHPQQLHDSINASFAGMAHFAGTGPNGARCRDCKFWVDVSRRLNKPCRKFKSLRGRRGPLVPGTASACKYFEEEDAMKVSDIYPSRFIKHADLNGKPVVKTITHVEEQVVGQAGDIRPVMFLEEMRQGMVLNQRNARFLADRFGDDTEEWAGKSVELYPTTVDLGGRPVNTIRLRLPVQKVGGGDAR